MGESLEDFLNVKKSQSVIEVNGSLACQQCYEIVPSGELDEDTMILSYVCNKNHRSQVKI